jgi:hypothetical protein
MLLVGAGVEVGVGDGVEQQVRRERDVAALFGHQRRRCRHVAADRVAGDDESTGVEALVDAVVGDPKCDGVVLFDRDRVLRLRREAVLREDDRGAGADHQFAHEPVVRVGVPEDPAEQFIPPISAPGECGISRVQVSEKPGRLPAVPRGSPCGR